MAEPVPSAVGEGADRRPYATLLAKGEDRRQRILGVAERLLARNGWRNTSLAQIAKEAGVTPAGLLHHFESKEQLLNAVLDARDADDDAHADTGPVTSSPSSAGCPSGSTAHPNSSARSRCCSSRTSRPTLHCTTACTSGIAPPSTSSPTSSSAVSGDGKYRPDFDAATKAVEILAFINGMETLWLLDPSIPLTEVFKGYADSLAVDLAPRSEA